MTQPLVKAGPGGLMQSGVKPSLDPLSAAFWIDGENVVFRKLGVEKNLGWSTDVVNINEDIFEMDQAFVEGNDRAYFAGVKRVSYWEAGIGHQQIYSFQSPSTIRLETWGTWLLMTNGVNPTVLWKEGEVVSIANLPFIWAKLLHRSNVHMLAANTSNGPDMIEWCSAGDVEDWEPLRENSAGNYTVRDLDGEIKALVDIGKQIAVYSSERLVTGRFSGQPHIFSFDPALSGIGAVGGRSVVSVGALNIGLSRQGVFETDGVDYRYVDEPDVQAWLQDNVDWEQAEKIYGYHNKLLEQVVWHFPAVSGGYLGIPYSYRTRVFGGRLTGKVTAAIERFVFDKPLAVVDKKFVFLNTGNNAGASALSSYIRTKPLDAGEGGIRKIFDYLRITGQWTGGKVRLGALEDPNDLDSITWFTDEAMAFEHFFYRDTPYVVVEFSASLLNETFRVSQFVLGGEPTGLRV